MSFVMPLSDLTATNEHKTVTITPALLSGHFAIFKSYYMNGLNKLFFFFFKKIQINCFKYK
jgi:hypothetical protein